MKKKRLVVVAAMVTVLMLSAEVPLGAQQQETVYGSQIMTPQERPEDHAETSIMNPLSAAEIQALNEALDDEYRAFATYDQVIADFGEVTPFINIRAAESRHIEALYTLFARYGLPVPANPWPGQVGRYASLQAACEAGVAAEIDNAALYDRLMGATQRPDILTVFRNLQEASQQRHLPAFQRCAQRGAGGGGGCQRRGGRGPRGGGGMGPGGRGGECHRHERQHV